MIVEDKNKQSVELRLAKEVNLLTKEVTRLHDCEFLKVFKNPWKFIGFSFLKGLMLGLGTVLGATVLVAIVAYLLAQMRFVPIIGDFVEEVITHIETSGSPQIKAPTESNFIQQYQQQKKVLEEENSTM